MKLLALDTSSVACSVALCDGDKVVERHEEQAREHTRLLMPMINAVLAEARLTVADLDAIALGNGPGSFIGMRIAAAVAQGLAHGAGIRIVPVSSLAVVAFEVLSTETVDDVFVAQDAHLNEVYLGAFGRGDDGLPVARFAERLQSQTPIDELAEDGRHAAAGHGWQRYPALLEVNRPRFALVSDALYPKARHALPLARDACARGLAIEPRDVSPAYLRHQVATPGP